MTSPPESSFEDPSVRPSRRRRRSGFSLRLTRGGIVFFLALNLGLLALLGWPLLQDRLQPPREAAILASETNEPATPQPTATSTISPSPPPSPTLTPTTTPSPLPTLNPFPSGGGSSLPADLVVLALDDGPNVHLFAYRPSDLPLTRLTGGPWDDIQPALSLGGARLAFSSNRNGYWNLYILDLESGSLTQVTDTLEYTGSPSWSPDGRWLAYETNLGEQDGGLEIFIAPTDGSQEPIRLTELPSVDHSPAWSPGGRQIAFVSDRSGDPEIWLADLDQVDEDRFLNLSQNPQASEAHPAWSPDGASLAWASIEDGFHNLYRLRLEAVEGGPSAKYLGSGDWPAWSSDGRVVLALLQQPNQTYLAAYPSSGDGLALPPFALPAQASGITWGGTEILDLPGPFTHLALLTPEPLWLPALTVEPPIPGGRMRLVPLDDVVAPQARLQDLVDESFIALREDLAKASGWDLLAALENAYVPITSVLSPGMRDDWLFTGRAFAFNTLPHDAGWIAVVREDYAPHTYWRVYLRARFQDGSSGLPLYGHPWDFSSRYSGSTLQYEDGGSPVEQIPAGYWLDLTRIASRYGWDRLPALPTWRSSFPAARFNVFANRAGLDWRSAMLEIYPPEAIVTATPVLPPTRTPSPTPRWYQTPTPTLTFTPRPTLTPLPPTPDVPAEPTATPAR
jgi:TolB protein